MHSHTMGFKRSKRHGEGNEEDPGYRFKVVLFLDDKEEKLSIDVAPEKWVFYSEESKTNLCRFPVGPFSNQDISDLHQKVQNCHLADESWPLHRVQIRGRARTYSEACDAAEKLQFDRYAFSTDRESSVERALREENELPRCRDLSDKTIDEELDEATVILADDAVIMNKEKTRSIRKKQRGKQKFSKQPPWSSPDSSSSDESTSQVQMKKGEHFRWRVSVPSSLSLISGGSLSKSSMKNDRGSSQNSLDSSSNESSRENPRSRPPRSPKKNAKKSHQISFDSETLLDVSSPEPKTSSGELALQVSKSYAESSSAPSPSASKKSSQKYLDSSAHSKTGLELLSRKVLPLSIHSSTPKTSKRNHSEMQGSSPEIDNEKQVDKRAKDHRRSRSRERRSFHEDHETLKNIPRPHQNSSTRIRISNRSYSAETPKQTNDRGREKRARSSEVNSSRCIVTNSAPVERVLPTVEENENHESLRVYMKSIYRSLSNKIDRLHGSHVETLGKLDHLINVLDKDFPTQEDSDDGNDVNNPDAIILPLDSLEKFHIFDAKLKDDKEYRMKIKKRIRNMVPQPTIQYATRNLSVIVRTFLTKKLVTESFVALKKTASKNALKDTSLYKCFLDVHLTVCGDQMNEKKFNEFLKNMFNSAADWDGGRLDRSKH